MRRSLKIYSMILVFTISQLTNVSKSYSYVERKWDFLLPRDVMQQLYSIKADRRLNEMEAESLINGVLSRLPRSLLDQLELPFYYTQLPFEAKCQVKTLLFDKDLTYRQEHETISSVLKSLPDQHIQPLRLRHKFWPSHARPQMKIPRAGFTLKNKNHVKPLSTGAFVKEESNNDQKTNADNIEWRQRRSTRLFNSYNALKYTVSFTFKLSELADTLPPTQLSYILNALEDNKLNIDQKISVIETQMADLDFDVIDHLFFGSLPIDAKTRENLRRVWLGRSLWQKVEPTTTEQENETIDNLPKNFNSNTFKTNMDDANKNYSQLIAKNSDMYGTNVLFPNNYVIKSPSYSNPSSSQWNNMNENDKKLETENKLDSFDHLNFGEDEKISSNEKIESVNKNKNNHNEPYICIDCMAVRINGASAIEEAQNFYSSSKPLPLAVETNSVVNNEFKKESSNNDSEFANIVQSNANEQVPVLVTSAALSLLQSHRTGPNMQRKAVDSENLFNIQQREFGRVKVERINNLLKLLREKIRKRDANVLNL